MDIELPNSLLLQEQQRIHENPSSKKSSHHEKIGKLQRSLSLPHVSSVSSDLSKLPERKNFEKLLLTGQDSNNSAVDSGLASGSILLRFGGGEDEDSTHSSNYCPSLLLGDIGLMLGGQVLLPRAGSRSRCDSVSGASVKGGPKVQGDFASGGSHMLASEPQSSAHSEVKKHIFDY